MTTSRKPPSPPAVGGAVERLIEAERRWRATLDEARAGAEHIVAEARAAVAAEEESTRAALDALVADRRAELQRTLDDERAAILERARREASAFESIDDERIRDLAAGIARTSPWLSSAEAQEGGG
jgi:vacuolar-type H+-ATPase subunit H